MSLISALRNAIFPKPQPYADILEGFTLKEIIGDDSCLFNARGLWDEDLTDEENNAYIKKAQRDAIKRAVQSHKEQLLQDKIDERNRILWESELEDIDDTELPEHITYEREFTDGQGFEYYRVRVPHGEGYFSTKLFNLKRYTLQNAIDYRNYTYEWNYNNINE